MEITVLIMAGGSGERFWPKSREKFPKQFLNIIDSNKTMLQLTIDRAREITNINNIFVATNEKYKDIVKQQIIDLPNENIISEPVGRNTAPCIGLAAMHISKKYDDSVMVVLPADHYIKDNQEFINTIKLAIDKAIDGESLVTIGIEPNYPETGYGYIKYIKDNNTIFPVDKFVEKPDIDRARQYLIEGNYLWNSGMFIWKTSTIINNFQEFLPDTYEKLIKIKKSIGTSNEKSILAEVFSTINKESIDYSIMEKAKKIFTVPGFFGWSDVGSWKYLESFKEKDDNNNVKIGDIISVDTSDCIISGDKRLIATLDVHNLIIVDTDDAILISSKSSINNIKQVINKIKENNKEEYI